MKTYINNSRKEDLHR